MKIEINRNDKTPVYIQIAGQIKNMLHMGVITDGYVEGQDGVFAKEEPAPKTTGWSAGMGF